MNHWIIESINLQSISRTAHPPLKWGEKFNIVSKLLFCLLPKPSVPAIFSGVPWYSFLANYKLSESSCSFLRIALTGQKLGSVLADWGWES